jgi:hypothetical protein
MIVGQTKGFSSRFPTSVFAAGILIICGWISPVAGAGADVSKEGFPKATPTQAAQHSESGSSMSQANYGGMVVKRRTERLRLEKAPNISLTTCSIN